MAPHQQRVVDEQVALDDKIVKLLKFLGTSVYHDLDSAEQARLQRQYKFMQGYSEVLAERIAAFVAGD
jgi:hypothetical protein